MKKGYLYTIIAVVVIGTGGYFWISGGNGNGVKYRTEKASRGNVVVNVRATGTINPVQTVQVGSQVSGLLSKIFVDFNDQVKKGQIIAIIDSTFLYASVNQAEANRERSQAQLNQAKRDYERTKELFNKQLVSQADLDAATATYETSVAQLKQSDAALSQSKVNLRYAIIRAPIDGVVISRDVDVGQTVAASLQAPKLFEIANDLKHMQVEASVDEADIGQVKTGQAVTFSVDAYPEEEFHGNVSQVRLSPITVQNVVTYTVIIEVPNPDMKLRPGMTATVSILIDKRDDVLRVPLLATRYQPPSDVLQKMNASVADTQDSATGGRGAARGGEAGEGNERHRTAADSARWQAMRDRFRAEGGGGGQQGGMRRHAQGDGQRKFSHLWVLQPGNTLKEVTVKTGLSDNRYIEVMGGGLKEGDEVVIGSTGGETANGQAQNNPFQQRSPGGRRGF